MDKPPPVAIYSSISRSGDKFQENTQCRWDESCQTQQAVAVQASGNLWLPKAAHPLLGEEGHHAETRKSLVKERLDERKACPTLPPGGGKLQHTTHSCFSNQEGERLQGESYAHHFQAPSVKIPVGSGGSQGCARAFARTISECWYGFCSD